MNRSFCEEVLLAMQGLSSVWDRIQHSLFPHLEETVGPLTEKQRELVALLEVIRIEEFVRRRPRGLPGHPESDRVALARAFVAKAAYNLPTTRALIDLVETSPSLRRLCGWERASGVPDESTFSRAFGEFARSELPRRVHEHLVRQHGVQKLVGHISRDATEIEAREKPVLKPKESETEKVPKKSRKRGRPRKGEEPAPQEPKRLERQVHQSAEEALAELPNQCDIGCKRDSKGHQHTWIGYKLHFDVADGDIPISAVLTSASLHDSQVAIPLSKLTESRVTHLYDLMDSAYDAKLIWQFSQDRGRVPIIDRNPRKGEKVRMDPAQAQRYNQRSSSERVNSQLKDNFGGSMVRVRGATKVMAHLMFGVLALTAHQLLRLLA